MNQRQASCMKLEVQYLINVSKLGTPSRGTISLFRVIILFMQRYQGSWNSHAK